VRELYVCPLRGANCEIALLCVPGSWRGKHAMTKLPKDHVTVSGALDDSTTDTGDRFIALQGRQPGQCEN
jgi:hypothetical protein